MDALSKKYDTVIDLRTEMSIPTRWGSVLGKIQDQYNPGAVIAGGALRDLENDRHIKDIDIFVPETPGVDSKAVFDQVFGYPGAVVADQLVEYENGQCGVLAVYDYPYEKPNDLSNNEFLVQQAMPNFQIIVINTAGIKLPFCMHLMSDFDIGLCRIYWTGLMLFREPSYLKDRDNKTLTYRFDGPSSRSKDRTLDRLERLQKKYPEFRAVQE